MLNTVKLRTRFKSFKITSLFASRLRRLLVPAFNSKKSCQTSFIPLFNYFSNGPEHEKGPRIGNDLSIIEIERDAIGYIAYIVLIERGKTQWGIRKDQSTITQISDPAGTNLQCKWTRKNGCDNALVSCLTTDDDEEDIQLLGLIIAS